MANETNIAFINNHKVILQSNLYTILQQCELLNIVVPRFCFHEKLSIAGNCRICLVEINTSFKLVVSCATMMSKNLVVNTISTSVKNSRENIIELLLINHPLDCPICDQGGECDLQDQTLLYGRDRSRFKEIKNTVLDKNISPFIKTIMTRCIHCTRCIRYFNEIIGFNILGTLGRGGYTEISNYIFQYDNTELSGNVVDLCPVGALTSKPYAYSVRPWELVNIESLDLLDSFCSRIRINMKDDKIVRILPSIINSRNEYWITNKIRYSYDAFMLQRIYTPRIRDLNTNLFIDVSWKKLFKYIKYNIYKFAESTNYMNHFYAYTSKFSDLESLILFKTFCKALEIDNLNVDFSIENDFYNSYLLNPNSIVPNLDSKLFILYGINTKIDNSIYNLKIRKLSLDNENTTLIYYIGNKIDLNFKNNHIGLTMSVLLDIYYGASDVCYDIINFDNTYFTTGKGAYNDDYNTLFFRDTIQKHINSNIEFQYNNLFSGEVSLLDLNLKSKIYCNIEDRDKSIPKFIYFYGYDEFNNFNLNYDKVFIIYHGHHLNTIINKVNVLIPSPTFIEKDGLFMDCYGLIHYNNSIFGNNSFDYNDYYILNGLYKYLTHDINYIYYNKNLYFNLKLPNYRNYNSLNNDLPFYNSNNILCKYYFKRNMMEDASFFYLQKDFYNMDIISRNSIILSKSLKTIKVYSNF